MPTLKLRLKRLGKKRIKNLPYPLEEEVGSLCELITACVRKEVERFNAAREEPEVLPFLSPAAIGEGAQAGKVSFGELSNLKSADVERAITVATKAWEDGVFAVFLDEEELRDLFVPLTISDGSTITFIRMTFLTGTFW